MCDTINPIIVCSGELTHGQVDADFDEVEPGMLLAFQITFK